MLLRLRTQLALSHAFVAIVCVLIISAIANLLLEKQFQTYIRRNLERTHLQLVGQIGNQYELAKWNDQVIEEIGIRALEQGLIVKVTDTMGRTIWDATAHNDSLCKTMILHMSQNMLSRYPNWKGGYIQNKYPIMDGKSTVGTVQIGYYGPFYYNDSDLSFINTLNRILYGVTFFAILFAIAIGALTARRVSTPISAVIKTARMIAQRDYKVHPPQRTRVQELNQLVETVHNLAEALHQQETLRKRLTADVAHELRTPLATLQSHLEAMIDGIWPIDTQRLKSCHDEVARVTRMVQDLGRLARFESEATQLSKTDFNLSDLVQSHMQNFQIEAGNKGIKLSFSGEPCQIHADRDKTGQVIVNLLSNALKYTPPGGEISLVVKEEPQWALLTVSDTGIGITDTDLPHIFERFYRADKSRTRLTGGSGIGLTICKAIVQAHAGHIWVRSKLNEGSEFTIALPRT